MADILTTIRLQADQYLQEGKKVEDQLRGIVQQEQAEAKQVTVTNAELAKAAKERNALLVKEKQTLADLTKLKAAAFNPKEIELYNSAIRKTEQNINTLKGATGGIEKQNSLLGSSFTKLGGIVAAAFSVTQIIAFGKASFDAFVKAELSAKKLQVAVGVNNGLQRDFEVLLRQSKELQKTTIFNDEQIQDAQTMALQFGLSAEQVKNLIPIIIDFASATGQDLASALSTVLRGTTGQTRGLKVYGVEVSAAATRTEKFSSIIGQLTEKFSGQGKIIGETAGGRLKQLSNAWDELKESIGSAIAPLVAGAASLAKSLIGVAEISLADKLEQERVALQGTALALSRLTEGSKERSLIIDEIEKKYPGLLHNLKGEELSNLEIAAALKKVNEQLINRIVLSIRDKEIEEVATKAAEAKNKEVKATKELNELIVKTAEAFKLQIPAGETAINQAARLQTELKKSVIQDEFGKRVNENIRAAQALEVASLAVVDANIEFNKEGNLGVVLQRERNKLAKEFNIITDESSLSSGGDFAKKTEEEIKAERDAAAKILEARQKIDKETRDATEQLRKFIFDELNKNADLEAANRKLIASQTIEEENSLQAAILAIDEETTKEKIQNAKDTIQPTEDLEKQLTEIHIKQNELKKKSDKDVADTQKSIQEEQIKQADELGDRLDKIAEETAKRQTESILSVIEAVGQVSNDINDLLQANSDNDIFRINERKDAATQAIDDEITKLEEKHEKGRIGDEAFEKSKKDLLTKRAASEKKYDEQVKSEKRKQAEIDKSIAIFNIILNTAVAVVKALPNVFLAALAGTAGAIQLALAIATPIPQFAKGTKDKKGSGLALVGERGPEAVFLPEHSKVLPANRTKQYGEFLNHMFDGTLENFLQRKYAQPAIKNNVNVNINNRDVVRAIRESNRDSIKIENLHELAGLFPQPNLRRTI